MAKLLFQTALTVSNTIPVGAIQPAKNVTAAVHMVTKVSPRRIAPRIPLKVRRFANQKQLRKRISSVTEFVQKNQFDAEILDLMKHSESSNNPLTKDMWFAKVIKKKRVESIRKGSERIGALPNRENSYRNEAFITAFDDVKHIQDPLEMARKASLFEDKQASKIKDLEGYAMVRFKLKPKGITGIRTPIETEGSIRPRGYGFVKGGRTGGGIREWVIDADAPMKGMIDLTSISVIREF